MKNIALILLLLDALLEVNAASAGLIGTNVDVDYVNDGNTTGNTSTSVTVQAGSGDAFQFGFSGFAGFTIDIEDTFVSLLCTGLACNTNPDLGPQYYIFSGLAMDLASVSLDPSSGCALCSASVSLLSSTSFEIRMPDLANPDLNDTLLVNMNFASVPASSSISLLLLGAGLLAFGRRQTRNSGA